MLENFCKSIFLKEYKNIIETLLDHLLSVFPLGKSSVSIQSKVETIIAKQVWATDSTNHRVELLERGGNLKNMRGRVHFEHSLIL